MADCSQTDTHMRWNIPANGGSGMVQSIASASCMNLYGGGVNGSCSAGTTGVHLNTCGDEKRGDVWRWDGKAGQLQFAGDPACDKLCVTPGRDGCLVVDLCNNPDTAGWQLVPTSP